MSTVESSKHEEMRDVCALPLVRRVAALLDRDPATLSESGPLPRGWHIAMFSVPTRQSELRGDGLAGLGVTLPDLGLPRIMAGGRRAHFHGDLVIGATARRVSRTAAVTHKQGKSGPLAIVTIEHLVFLEGASAKPVLTEQQDYVMLPEAARTPTSTKTQPPPGEAWTSALRRTVIPDETMLLRYCAITYNAHRIHYDLPYATGKESYPALVVNGGLPVIFLLEMLSEENRRALTHMTVRNVGPLFCGRPMHLNALAQNSGWTLWASDEQDRIAVEMDVR